MLKFPTITLSEAYKVSSGYIRVLWQNHSKSVPRFDHSRIEIECAARFLLLSSDEFGIGVGAGGPSLGQPPVAAAGPDPAHVAKHQADGHGGPVQEEVAEPAGQPQVVVDHHSSSSSSAGGEPERRQAEGHLRYAHSVRTRGDDDLVHDTALPVK